MKRWAVPLMLGVGTLLVATPIAKKYFGEMDMTYGFVGLGAALVAAGIGALIQRPRTPYP
jgi:hypothetical protein